jgi:hypothetical protein
MTERIIPQLLAAPLHPQDPYGAIMTTFHVCRGIGNVRRSCGMKVELMVLVNSHLKAMHLLSIEFM